MPQLSLLRKLLRRTTRIVASRFHRQRGPAQAGRILQMQVSERHRKRGSPDNKRAGLSCLSIPGGFPKATLTRIHHWRTSEAARVARRCRVGASVHESSPGFASGALASKHPHV
eukprot:scaffold374_cov271-Pinguiococcus_pyrenoidosus.AAC.21